MTAALPLITAWLLASALPAALAQGHAHQHGVLRLDIAVEPKRITLQLDTPLDNLVGFERAPRNDAERKRVAAAVAALKGGVFRIDPAAQCVAAEVELTSAALGMAVPAAKAEGEHAELEASFSFTCQGAARAAFVDTTLFAAFPGLRRIEVQIAGPQGQSKRTLDRPAQRIPLAR